MSIQPVAERPVIAVIGDPMSPSERMAGPIRTLLGEAYDIVTADWDLSYDEAVAANLAIEKGGPAAVPTEIDLPVAAARVVAIATQFFPLSAKTLETWPSLKVVATLRAGIDNIDADELARRGVLLVRNLGRNANAVAELTVGMILGRLRGIGEGHHSMRNGGWRAAPYDEGYRELAGTSVGLVGLGAIGSLVLKRLSGFEVDAAYYDPYTDPSSVPGARSVGLDEILRNSDIVSLHARVTAETHHLIGERELGMMRPSSILVNTARAELVDEEALVRTLVAGGISGAALDVYSIEPLPSDHALRSIHSAILSPHLAGVTTEARSRAPQLLANRLKEALA